MPLAVKRILKDCKKILKIFLFSHKHIHLQRFKTANAGKGLNQTELTEKETKQAVENRIIEMINQGLDEEQIIEMLGDKSKKSQVAGLMKKYGTALEM